MKNRYWKQLALSMLSGGMLFQVTGCTDAALGITTIATAITAGGVIYIIQKIMH
jgi:hypothetical protein